MSDIIGIQRAIVNGVEISITMIPNTDNLCLQSFKNNTYGKIVIDNIYMHVCKMHNPVSCNCAIAVLTVKQHVITSTELYRQGIAPGSQYSDPAAEAATLH